MVAATADHSSVVTEDGDVDFTEYLLIRSATVSSTNGTKPLVLDGAVYCDTAESRRHVGTTN